MSHYDPSQHNVKLRCDGDHEFGPPYMHNSEISLVLDDTNVCVRLSWTIYRTCTNEHTNDVSTATRTCQKVTVVDRDSSTVPVEELVDTHDD